MINIDFGPEVYICLNLKKPILNNFFLHTREYQILNWYEIFHQQAHLLLLVTGAYTLGENHSIYTSNVQKTPEKSKTGFGKYVLKTTQN